MPKTARRSDARGRRLKLITAVALVILAGFAGVLAWQRWPTQEQPPAAEIARKEEKAVIAAPAPAPAPTRRALKPLDAFTDCGGCPEMVMIPGGTFMIGSPADEPGRFSDEGPRHQVTIEPFAMGKTEVTFAEWDACVTAGGCNGYKRLPLPWGRGSQPVVAVSWKDAKAYVSWLSQHTGQPYRLPSEAEWEYAARAGTTTRYASGDAITPKDANYLAVISLRPPKWAPMRRTPGVSMTCTATPWSGSRTSTTTATRALRPMAPRGRTVKEKIPLLAASSAAVPRSAVRGSFVRRPATGLSRPTAAAGISGSALPGRSIRT